jgi:membrane protein DedA with SNARE-associated domain
MPLAGFTANSVAVTAAQSSGELFYQVQSLAGLVGFTLSQLVWYYPSKILTIRRLLRLADKYGKWITVSSKDITRSIESLDHQGIKAIFIRRLLPGVRTLILIPAGIGNKLLLSFLFYTTLGSAL